MDDLSEKQKRRQIKRVHDILFEYHEALEGKSVVSLKAEYMDIFNTHFPASTHMSVDDLENAIHQCTKAMLAEIIKDNKSVNESYGEAIIANIILQFVSQALSIVQADIPLDQDSDFMYN